MDALYEVFVVNRKTRKMVEIIYVVTRGKVKAQVEAALQSEILTGSADGYHLIVRELGEVPDAE